MSTQLSIKEYSHYKLRHSCSTNNIEEFKALLNDKAVLQWFSSSKSLNTAIYKGHLDMVCYILSLDNNLWSLSDGWGVLHAILQGHVEVLKVLMKENEMNGTIIYTLNNEFLDRFFTIIDYIFYKKDIKQQLLCIYTLLSSDLHKSLKEKVLFKCPKAVNDMFKVKSKSVYDK